MKKYKVLRDCVGFLGKRGREGQIEKFEDNVKPPHHFKQIPNSVKEAKELELKQQVPLSQLHQKPQVKNGFATGAKETQVEKPQTAASAANQSPETAEANAETAQVDGEASPPESEADSTAQPAHEVTQPATSSETPNEPHKKKK